MRIDKKYKYKTTPLARKEAIVGGDTYRFTILTPNLIRIEYNESGYFEDRATQIVVNRVFDVPEYNVEDTDDLLTITTEHVELTYTKKPFSKNSLSVRYVGENTGMYAGWPAVQWQFGQEEKRDFGGTARTLDTVDGACELESGIMSRGTITVLDDSDSLIICDDGWIEPRKEKYIDQYLFCYGNLKTRFFYKKCLRDFYQLTGKTPLIPRFTLGNWWSRYYAYTQEEYINLMQRFKKEDIPFSVAVIDMDWHYVKIDPKYGMGWTGYTWNKELFPDHKSFLKYLHDEDMEYVYLPENEGYIKVQLSSGASNNSVKYLRLYEIKDEVVYPETQGTYFNLEYAIQPENEITSLSIKDGDGEIILPVTRIASKKYSVDLSNLDWNIKSEKKTLTLPAYTGIYGKTVPQQNVILNPIQEFVSVNDVICSISDNKYIVSANVMSNYKNSSETTEAKAVCAVYKNGQLTDIDLKDIKDEKSTITFEPLEQGDNCKIYVFESFENIFPLAKAKTVVNYK